MILGLEDSYVVEWEVYAYCLRGDSILLSEKPDYFVWTGDK